MKWEIWVPVLISIVALLPGVYAFTKTIKQTTIEKSDIVFKNAVTLIEENRRQAEENGKQLARAHSTIDEITAKLHAANNRADILASSLAEANIEIIALRAQIESMSKQVDGETA